MSGYIDKFLAWYVHPRPSRPQIFLHHHYHISYGAKIQQPAAPDSCPPLDEDGIKYVEGIVGTLLWYVRAVDKKLLVALKSIGHKQDASTKADTEANHQFLDYVDMYPNNIFTHRGSNMVLAGQYDAGYLNENCACSRAGAHTLLSEDYRMPLHNGPIITIAKIIKFVMSSATKSKVAAVLFATKKMSPLHQKHVELRWTQPPSTLQTENSTAAGVTNITILTCQTKGIYMQFYWLR